MTSRPAKAKKKNKNKASKSAGSGGKTKRTTLSIKRLAHGEELALPAYQSKGAAGMDLHAACAERETIIVPAGGRVLVPTGLVFELERGFEAQVRPRSGLALKHGITVLNSPGTIDSDYRGEVGVILANLGTEDFKVRRGDRIAQVVVATVTQARVVEIHDVSETKRGSGGFGSTGGQIGSPNLEKKTDSKGGKSKRSQTDSSGSKSKKRKAK